MKRVLPTCLVALSFSLAAVLACETSSLKKRGLTDKCGKNLDCAYGLECAPGGAAIAAADAGVAPAPAAGSAPSSDGGAALSTGDASSSSAAPSGGAVADAGPAQSLAQAGKTCQWKTFGDCDGEGVTANGEHQCLSGQKCRDNKCTVQCASKRDCKDNEVCKVGICQKGAGALTQCYDNRDCVWPESCFYGQCVTRTETLRCQTDLDCGIGYRCINGRCQ